MKNKKVIVGLICAILLLIIVILLLIFDKEPKKINEVDAKNLTNKELLMLVNYENKIPDTYEVLLIEYDGYEISKYIYNDFIEMINAAKKEYLEIEITSSYRSYYEQEKIYNERMSKYLNLGMKKEDAKILTEKEVAVPGYSEHETGLALDLSTMGDDKQKEKVWDYLKNNSYKYGFINRYPIEKENITKIKYEPWHFRYVGKQNAKKIYESGLCLEEYLMENNNEN